MADVSAHDPLRHRGARGRARAIERARTRAGHAPAGRRHRRLRQHRPAHQPQPAVEHAGHRTRPGRTRCGALALHPGSRDRRALHPRRRRPGNHLARRRTRQPHVLAGARTGTGHAPDAASAAVRTRDPGVGARPACGARGQRVRAPCTRAQAEARHQCRLSRLAAGLPRDRHRRGEPQPAGREPARQRLAVPQRQDHAGPGPACACRIAGGRTTAARSAEQPGPGTELPELPVEP